MRRMTTPHGLRLLLPLVAAGALLLAGCGGSDPEKPDATAAGSTAASGPADDAPASDPGPSLPPGAQPGHDDHDEDGFPDPTCATQDFGGGLVLRIPCTIGNAHEPERGTRLVPDSLYRLPSSNTDMDGISGSMVAARDPAGAKVLVVVFNSDNLFATGSDAISDDNTLDAVITMINAKYAGAAIQVRGHTDRTGTASANQALSERRAAQVRAHLTANGVRASGVTAQGFGSTRPIVEETNADGSVSEAGRAFNRRVELVLRVP